jgi:hypothetical protein
VTTKALEVYDQQRFGPVLGVSDEGAAAQTIADAAYASAKAKAVDAADAMVVGMILDGERMGSAGEVPIGPDEYAQVLPAAQGRIFCTTNVGVRVNTRFYQPLPEFRVADAQSDEQKWLDGIFEKFKPFINTPDGNPRPLMVRLVTESRQCQDALRELVPKLEAGRKNGRLGSSDLHRLSILVVFDDEIRTSAEVEQIRQLMTLASELGVPEVAVDGRLVEAARRRISIQGLLNILDPDTARSLLRLGQELGVRVTYHFELDPETAARTVWTGLNSAHGCGLTAAKYGLFPLKLDQQRHVVRNVQRWMGDWTPIPAFYVDTALVTDDDVFESDRCVEAARLWGILSMDDVATLLGHAQNIGLKVLWSGGNSAQQAYELGKLGVFGIFTTGSTARVVPVHGTLEGDKQLAMEKEPTELGVRRVHALLQGGYVWSVLGDGDGQIRDEIEARSVTLLGAASDSDACRTALASFDEVLVRGWKKYWADVA